MFASPKPCHNENWSSSRHDRAPEKNQHGSVFNESTDWCLNTPTKKRVLPVMSPMKKWRFEESPCEKRKGQSSPMQIRNFDIGASDSPLVRKSSQQSSNSGSESKPFANVVLSPFVAQPTHPEIASAFLFKDDEEMIDEECFDFTSDKQND